MDTMTDKKNSSRLTEQGNLALKLVSHILKMPVSLGEYKICGKHPGYGLPSSFTDDPTVTLIYRPEFGQIDKKLLPVCERLGKLLSDYKFIGAMNKCLNDNILEGTKNGLVISEKDKKDYITDAGSSKTYIINEYDRHGYRLAISTKYKISLDDVTSFNYALIIIFGDGRISRNIENFNAISAKSCAICREQFSGSVTKHDSHILAASMEGTENKCNICFCCKSCNLQMGARNMGFVFYDNLQSRGLLYTSNNPLEYIACRMIEIIYNENKDIDKKCNILNLSAAAIIKKRTEKCNARGTSKDRGDDSEWLAKISEYEQTVKTLIDERTELLRRQNFTPEIDAKMQKLVQENQQLKAVVTAEIKRAIDARDKEWKEACDERIRRFNEIKSTLDDKVLALTEENKNLRSLIPDSLQETNIDSMAMLSSENNRLTLENEQLKQDVNDLAQQRDKLMQARTRVPNLRRTTKNTSTTNDSKTYIMYKEATTKLSEQQIEIVRLREHYGQMQANYHVERSRIRELECQLEEQNKCSQKNAREYTRLYNELYNLQRTSICTIITVRIKQWLGYRQY